MLTKKINNARVRYTITHYSATYSRYPTYVRTRRSFSRCEPMWHHDTLTRIPLV